MDECPLQQLLAVFLPIALDGGNFTVHIAPIEITKKRKPMNAELLNIHFSYDAATGQLSKRIGCKAGKLVGWRDPQGYIKVRFLGETYLAHRLIICMTSGEMPEVVDHLNGDRSDNRLCNLRAASVAENNRNAKQRADNTSGVTGVYWHTRKNKWRAQIAVAGKDISLGYFDSFDDAISARKAGEARHGFHMNHGRAA
jgi:hypothetical protein